MAVFELSVIVISIAFLLLTHKLYKSIWKKYGIIFCGVLLFEYFTQALWINKGLEAWSYLYLDVNWIITLGWSTIIIVCMTLVNAYANNAGNLAKLLYYIISVSIVGIIAEQVVLGLGIREYSSAVLEVLSGTKMGIVPIEALYYIPTFMALVIAFVIYWMPAAAARKSR